MRDRLVPLLTGVATVVPALVAEEVLTTPAAAARWPPLMLPMSLGAALIAVTVARLIVKGTGPWSTVALAGGATLGFFVGRTAFHSLWSAGFATPGRPLAKAAAVLAVAAAAALGALTMNAVAARRSPRAA
jgi:hypothetical protein